MKRIVAKAAGHIAWVGKYWLLYFVHSFFNLQWLYNTGRRKSHLNWGLSSNGHSDAVKRDHDLMMCGSERSNLHLSASVLTSLALLCLDLIPTLALICSFLINSEMRGNVFFCIIFRSPVSYFRSEKRLVALRPLGTYFSGWKLDEHNEPLCKFNISSIPKVKEKLMTIFYILKSVMKLTLHFMFLSFKKKKNN